MDLIIAWRKESDLKCLVPELLLKSLGSTWVWALLIHTRRVSGHLVIWVFGLSFFGGLFFLRMLKLNCDKDSNKALLMPLLSLPGPQFCQYVLVWALWEWLKCLCDISLDLDRTGFFWIQVTHFCLIERTELGFVHHCREEPAQWKPKGSQGRFMQNGKSEKDSAPWNECFLSFVSFILNINSLTFNFDL